MKRFKYQALVTLEALGGAAVILPSPVCRMVVRARDRQTGQGKLFGALVSGDQTLPAPGHSQVLVTMVVAGDDAGDYLAPGDEFSLWREGPAGDGVVTRRLFV